jgi:alpha-glucosidase
MHRFAVALATLILAASSAASGQQGRQYQVQSPDGATQLTVEVGPQLSYSVTHRGRPLLSSSPISLTLQGGRVLGAGDRVRSEARRQVRDSVLPLAPTKSGVVRDRYNELRLRFTGYDLELRAYDEGVAYRWVLALGDSAVIGSEQATFALAGPATAIIGIDSTFQTHQEPVYQRVRLDTLRNGRRSLLPALVALDNGPKVAITESQLEDYPGMYLVAGAAPNSAIGLFPQAALEEQAKNDRDVVVTIWRGRRGGVACPGASS